MAEKIIPVIFILLLLIITIVFIYGFVGKEPSFSSRLHLDCTKEINCGYCKKINIPCPKVT